mgnify:CR=1 FL=1
MAVGLAGNIRFVGNVKAQLSLSFDTGGGWDDTANLPNRIAILLYCFQLIPTYAVLYFCAYEAVELKILRAWDMGRYTADHRKLKPQIVLVRWFWVAVSGAIALVVPKFGDYLGLIGAVGTPACPARVASRSARARRCPDISEYMHLELVRACARARVHDDTYDVRARDYTWSVVIVETCAHVCNVEEETLDCKCTCQYVRPTMGAHKPF